MKINLNEKFAMKVYCFIHFSSVCLLQICNAIFILLITFYINFNTEIPIKRTRRSMVPSPSPAEGQASKPESTAIMSEVSIVIYCSI